jgi:hypothetical protein
MSDKRKQTLRLHEVAVVLGVGKVSHADLHRQGIPHIHMDGPHDAGDYAAGRRPLVSVRALEAWLDKAGAA